MNKKQWVQHISGVGEKWEVLTEEQRHWRTKDGDIFMWLPKSEYRLCEPPEVWRDVTEECVVIGGVILSHQGADVNAADGYRLCKVRVYPYRQPTEITTWAFIVEQKVS